MPNKNNQGIHSMLIICTQIDKSAFEHSLEKVSAFRACMEKVLRECMYMREADRWLEHAKPTPKKWDTKESILKNIYRTDMQIYSKNRMKKK
uniref:Uncharacterized protein n=1 Tax=Romanomermis culicivorax TaxID=13658 RepID=A0A915L4T1_ROMCU